MNQRIKELAEQVYGSAHYDDFKFAELIVRECAQLADDTPSDYLLQPYKYPSTYIKEHFGVEL